MTWTYDAVRLRSYVAFHLIDYLTTEVENGTLIIDLRPPKPIDVKRLGAAAIGLPHLRALSNDDVGGVIASSDESESLSLRNASTGTLEFTGTIGALDAKASGTGRLVLHGSAPSAELVSTGTGAMDARDFSAVNGNVSATSVGGISATFTGSVTASASGIGDIDLYGGAVVTANESQLGKITQH